MQKIALKPLLASFSIMMSSYQSLSAKDPPKFSDDSNWPAIFAMVMCENQPGYVEINSDTPRIVIDIAIVGNNYQSTHMTWLKPSCAFLIAKPLGADRPLERNLDSFLNDFYGGRGNTAELTSLSSPLQLLPTYLDGIGADSGYDFLDAFSETFLTFRDVNLDRTMSHDEYRPFPDRFRDDIKIQISEDWFENEYADYSIHRRILRSSSYGHVGGGHDIIGEVMRGPLKGQKIFIVALKYEVD